MFVGLLSVPHLFSIETLYIGCSSPCVIFPNGLFDSFRPSITSLTHKFGAEMFEVRKALVEMLEMDNIDRQITLNVFTVRHMVKQLS